MRTDASISIDCMDLPVNRVDREVARKRGNDRIPIERDGRSDRAPPTIACAQLGMEVGSQLLLQMLGGNFQNLVAIA